MKNLFNNLSELEKQTILEMHQFKKESINEDRLDRMARRQSRQTSRENVKQVKLGNVDRVQSSTLESEKMRLSGLAKQLSGDLQETLTTCDELIKRLEDEKRASTIGGKYATDLDAYKNNLKNYRAAVANMITQNTNIQNIKLPVKQPAAPAPKAAPSPKMSPTTAPNTPTA
jgi:hypothetical protein